MQELDDHGMLNNKKVQSGGSTTSNNIKVEYNQQFKGWSKTLENREVARSKHMNKHLDIFYSRK